MEKELTQGPVMKTMLLFAIPMILGDLLQQCYNIADTLIVGKFLGVEALAAVGSAFSLMTFVTSILLGLAMGSGTVFSIFTAQNFGAKKQDRIRKGIRVAVLTSFSFSLLVSALVFSFAAPLMSLFLDAKETAVIAEGVRYLRIEGAFYCLIGGLFLLYGLYRALGQPGMSVVLTIVSLGTRVGLAYLLSAIPAVGVVGIWWAVPIGWFLADALGVGYYLLRPAKALSQREYRS